jgi:hypothetical protein
MPKKSTMRKLNKKNSRKTKTKTRKNTSRKNKIKIKFRGGGPSVSCKDAGSVDHKPAQWNSGSGVIMGGSINDDLYNYSTDASPYSI